MALIIIVMDRLMKDAVLAILIILMVTMMAMEKQIAQQQVIVLLLPRTMQHLMEIVMMVMLQ